MTEGTKQKNFVIGCIYTYPKIVSVSIKPLNLCGNVWQSTTFINGGEFCYSFVFMLIRPTRLSLV